MCGNSICQDRRFLARQMPRLEAFFHYRNLDVSTIKELVTRWKPEVMKNFTKESSHQALDDIYESIAMTAPGIVAHESALEGGKQLKVPHYDEA